MSRRRLHWLTGLTRPANPIPPRLGEPRCQHRCAPCLCSYLLCAATGLLSVGHIEQGGRGWNRAVDGRKKEKEKGRKGGWIRLDDLVMKDCLTITGFHYSIVRIISYMPDVQWYRVAACEYILCFLTFKLRNHPQGFLLLRTVRTQRGTQLFYLVEGLKVKYICCQVQQGEIVTRSVPFLRVIS